MVLIWSSCGAVSAIGILRVLPHVRHAGVLRPFSACWAVDFGRFFLGRGAASCEAVARVSASLSATTARHFAGWTRRSARNWRFSASLNVASYARRSRVSWRQARSASTANAIGTKGIMCQAITLAPRLQQRLARIVERGKVADDCAADVDGDAAG